MNRLKKCFFAFLIGLSFLGCDPAESFYIDFYQRTFENTSNTDIKIVYHRMVSNEEKSDTLIVLSNTKKNANFVSAISSDGVSDNDFDLIKKENIDVYYDNLNDYGKFELFVGNSLIKEWIGPPDYHPIEVNSPFNYNSWYIIKYIKPERDGDYFKYGEIVFTISNEDI